MVFSGLIHPSPMGNPLQGGDVVPSFFTCEICIEPVSSAKKFRNHKSCSRSSYCVDCVSKYVESKIEEYNMSKITCPNSDCGELLDPHRYRSALPARVFERWCDALCEAAVLKFQRAYCPHLDCSALILNECGGKIRKAKCPKCKKWLCFKCEIPWHAGYRCNESREQRDENDIRLGQLMEEKKWMKCPVCNHGVELHSGCEFVRCRCGTLFCHACGRKRTREWCWCKRHFRGNLLLLIMLVVAIFIFCVGIQWMAFVAEHHQQ